MIVKQYLIIDVEATCWDNREKQLESEIIEIGSVLFNSEKKTIVDEFQSFIRPIRNPILSKFCSELTSIEQHQVENAPIFPEVIEDLKEKILNKQDLMLASWGKYDKNQFKRDCEFHKIEYPFGEDHLNIKKMFAKKMMCKPCGMSHALNMLHIPLEGTHHRGIDDAQNIVKIFEAII